MVPGCVSRQQTPLNRAVQAGDRDRVRALLDAGAKVDEPDFLGQTPLLFAVSKGDEDLVVLLWRQGAAVNHPASGGTPLLPAPGWPS